MQIVLIGITMATGWLSKMFILMSTKKLKKLLMEREKKAEEIGAIKGLTKGVELGYKMRLSEQTRKGFIIGGNMNISASPEVLKELGLEDALNQAVDSGLMSSEKPLSPKVIKEIEEMMK